MWVAVVGAVVLLSLISRDHRQKQVVTDVRVTIVDSVRCGNLVTKQMVEAMLKKGRFKLLEERVDQLPLTQVENYIGNNGYVRGVATYVDYRGVLSIDVTQRQALVRLLVDGYNCYLTSDGFIFPTPTFGALDTPVVTGGYKPLFGAGYVGSIVDCADALVDKLELQIAQVEREKYPIFIREADNDADRRDVRKQFINRSIFESEDQFDRRVVELREKNRKRRELYAYRQRVIDADMAHLEGRQQRLRDEQKKIRKKCEDIYNLITFVEMVEEEPFWSSEIVQILLDFTDNGQMKAGFAVRSGNFIVDFGELGGDREQMKAKVARLEQFYREALPRVGWDRYKQISLEFRNQVVCKR